MTANESYLLQLARQGNSAACSELFDRHYDAVFRYCYYHVGNAGQAQDLTNEVFVRMVDKLDTLDEHSRPLLTWLYATARNVITLSLNEPHLIHLVRQGDPAACSSLYDRYYNAIYHYCYYHVGDVALAQHLTGQVFVQMVKRIAQLDKYEQRVLTWLYDIARQLIADARRWRGQSPLPDTPAPRPNQRDLAKPRLVAEDLMMALSRLTEQDRQVILFQFVENRRGDEAAHLLGQARATFPAQSHRALAVLEQALGEYLTMNDQFDAVLDECLELLRLGMAVRDCLALYPQYADKLRPLLELAANVHAVVAPAPVSAARLAGRQRMMATLAQRRTRTAVSALAALHRAPPVKRTFSRPRFRTTPHVLRFALAMMIVIAFATSGAVAASASSLPGDTLYPVKLAAQQAQIALTLDTTTRSQLEEHAQTQRQQDIQTAQRAGRQATVEVEGWLEQIDGEGWVVSGMRITLKPETMLAGQPQIGAWVTARSQLPGDGTLVAKHLVVQDKTKPWPTVTGHPTALPTTTLIPTETLVPTPLATPMYEPEPTRTPKPTEEIKPTHTPKPTEELEPTKTPKPTDEPKPTRTPRPTDDPRPTQEPKPTKDPKPPGKP